MINVMLNVEALKAFAALALIIWGFGTICTDLEFIMN